MTRQPTPRQSKVTQIRKFTRWLIGILLTLGVAYHFILWPRMRRWGATDDEIKASLPGDEYIDKPLLTTTKAITIQATPTEIWPWLQQLGVDRGGMYSYLWVENWLLRLNVTNAHQIHLEWQTLEVGDFIRFTPKDYPINPGPGLHIKQIITEQVLVGCFGLENTPPNCNQSATWQFILQPLDKDATRLLLRSNTAGSPTYLARWLGELGQSFQFYMERKMLLTLKQRCEIAKITCQSDQVSYYPHDQLITNPMVDLDSKNMR